MPLLKMAWGMWEICQQGHFPRCQWVQTRGWMLRGSADWCSCSTESRWYMQRVLAHSWWITVLVWCRYGHWLISAADSQYCITWILLIQQSVLIKAEDTGKLTRILSYNTHTHTLICLKLLHITFECTESRLTWDVCSSPHSPPQNVGSRGATWGPSHIGGERKKKQKLAAAVGSRQRCTAAENSQDADASKRFQTEAPLSVHCPCSALQMSSLKAGKCNTRRISIRSAKREVQPQCLTEWWMISLSQSCATHKRQIRLVKIFLYFSALQNSTSGAVHLG